MRHWIDVSMPLRNGMTVWPGDPEVRIERVGGLEYTLSTISMTVHAGTHVDAPLHFLADGAPIDTLPLDALIGAARVVDSAGAEVQRGERVLYKGVAEIPPDVARRLAAAAVRAVGVEGLSAGGEETHRILMRAGVWIIENLDLSAAAPGEYEMVCLPLRIAGAEGAPCRAILRAR